MRLSGLNRLLSGLTVNFQHLKCTSDSQGIILHRINCRRKPLWIVPLRAMSSSPSVPSPGNRLRLEKSPYLLQHANNPIDWYPFGPEAIAKAKAEDKPIFLSVGYASCHWCHVMEHESFMSAEVAEIMNKHFVSIKVDREERPDVDKIYMAFLLMINRSGGWPMNVWLTPDLSPITAGTYFPPETRWGVPSFKSVLLQIADKWETERESLLSTGQSVIKIMKKSVEGDQEQEDGVTIMGKFNESVKIFKYTFDKAWGGFNGAPKFPEVSKLNFLLHGYLLKQDKELLNIVTKSLERIAQGGIHDHVFGGFSRYAVDRKWHVPHFEKMLYDQAQLMTIYANAFKVTRDPAYLAICEKTFEYLVTDLCHSTGGFYSGEDADSLPTAGSEEKIEGSFYAWTHDEIRQRFETERDRFPGTVEPELPFQIFCDHFDVQEGGNVSPDNDPQGHFLEKNILFAKDSVQETERRYPGVDIQGIIRVGCEILHEERKFRPRPDLDTKLICAWNGLMLAGLSQLVAISEGEKRDRYLAQTQKLVDFIRNNFYNAEEKTLKRSCYGDADKLAECRFIPGFLDDYAFLIRGLLAFYLVSMDNSVLVWAKELQETQNRLFFDEENGGYFYTQGDLEHIVVRLKEDHDGAEPCGNSVSITNLLQLGTYFDEKSFKANALKCINFFKSNGSLGYAMPELMCGALLLEQGLDMMVVVGPKVEATENLLRIAQQAYAPGLVTFHLQTDNPESVLRESVKSFKMVNNSPTVYLCHNKVCQLPITDARKLEETLESRFEAAN